MDARGCPIAVSSRTRAPSVRIAIYSYIACRALQRHSHHPVGVVIIVFFYQIMEAPRCHFAQGVYGVVVLLTLQQSGGGLQSTTMTVWMLIRSQLVRY